MTENKVGFASQCHPEPQPLPLGCALKSSCSGSHQTMNSGSRCLDNQSGEMPNQVWHDTSFGFTLIELLVVVLIIGILAAVALPQYQKAVERSRMAEAMQRLGDYASAQQLYYMHNNGFASAYSTLNQGDIKVPEQTEVGNWNTSDSRWSVASASGSSLEKVTMSALRTGGIYKDCVLTLSVDASGKIEKTCSGNDECCIAAQNGGYEVDMSSPEPPEPDLYYPSTYDSYHYVGPGNLYYTSGSSAGPGKYGAYVNNTVYPFCNEYWASDCTSCAEYYGYYYESYSSYGH